ncbi:MAG: HD domain-containing protein [Bacteroidota bacterium]
MLLLNLVDWRQFVVLLLTGIVLGVLYVRPGSLSYENTHMLVYAITFSTLVGLLFARRKEQHITQERRFLKGRGEAQQVNLLKSAVENRKVLKALQNTGAGNLLTMIRSLHELDVKKADSAKLEALERDLIPVAFQLQGIDTRSQDYLRLHIQEDRPIEELLSAVKEKLQVSGIRASVKSINEAQCQTVTGDFEQLTDLITESIALLQGAFKEDDEEQIILISLKDTQLTYPLPDVEKNYIKHVPALRVAMTTTEQVPAVAPSYTPDLNGSGKMSSEATQELDRLANARIVKAHYGYAEMTNDTLLYVIPTDVREVRPRDMDKAYMEVDATPKRADDQYKSDTVDAQAQEAAFLTDVAARSDVDLGLIKMALELIKWYHGPSERKSGEPFYLHPLTVAHIVLSYDQDEATIIGALLHDTVEDTPMLLQHIKTVFGRETAEVVDLVTHLQSTEGSIYKIKMSALENLQMLDRAGNRRGLYVKIADRMHNMRTINGHSKVSKRKLVAQETIDFFLPLAQKLGLKEAAAEFEKMCEEVFKQKD